MARPRLPLSAFERTKLQSVRISGVVVLVLGLAVTALAVRAGREETAVLVFMAVAYGGGIWSIGLRIPWLTALLLSITPVTCGFLVGHPLIGAVAAAGLFGWLSFQSGLARSLSPESLKVLEPDAVDPEAAASVTAFEALGFERAGAFGFEPVAGKTVVATLLVGPAADRYAVVTELVVDVVSAFGDRVLVTRNSASAPLPADCLGNDMRGAEPAELLEGHRRALEILATRGLTPDPIRREHVLDTQLAIERRTLEWARSNLGRTKAASFFGSGAGSGGLDDGPASERRIDAWLTATSPAL